MNRPQLVLKKHEDRRIRSGHPWIFSNEIDNTLSPLRGFSSGEEVVVRSAEQKILGIAYVNPHSLIAARMLSSENIPIDLDFFVRRLKNALDFRAKYFAEPFYRLVYSEADGLAGLIIDRFEHDLVLQLNTAGMEQKKELICEALLQVLPQTQSILLRNDSLIRLHEGLDTYIETAFGHAPSERLLRENHLSFLIPFCTAQKTGWFYDHRNNRARIQAYAHQARVLDVFSYLGAFGLHAAVAGALQVDFIESSALAADYIQKNAMLNQVNDRIRVYTEDAFEALKALALEKKTYDLIILDPPAFVKKKKDLKTGLRAYQRLNELALELLVEGGILVSCSCSMHVNIQDFLAMLQHAALRSGVELQLLERGYQDCDHPVHLCIPESDYLKAMVLRKHSR